MLTKLSSYYKKIRASYALKITFLIAILLLILISGFIFVHVDNYESVSIYVQIYCIFSFITLISILFFLIFQMVDTPVTLMVEEIHSVAHSKSSSIIKKNQHTHLKELTSLIKWLSSDFHTKHKELSEKQQIYQTLFDQAPCLITVQDKEYKIIQCNKTFADKFQARLGDYCYRAYKGRNRKCEECPVERTLKNGESHSTEETGAYKDGQRAHWIVNTAPIYDDKGNIIAAMEMSLDITLRKQLEEKLKSSEQKYYAIFNNIPSAVLVIDANTLEVMDCNQTAISLYGHRKGSIVRNSVLKLISQDECTAHIDAFNLSKGLKRTKHITSTGAAFWAMVNITRSRFDNRDVLLAAVTDISERISSEEQLIQTSKMATLGEMATGVAHELNQPLAVLQMVANLFRRKVKSGKTIDTSMAENMALKITNNVERATKIISHMREFGRKTSIETEEVDLNEVIHRASELFNQQLALHDIKINWELALELPPILADPNRLEQVFINMFINARDAIDERCARETKCLREITIRTRANRRTIVAEVIDTGIGIQQDILQRLFEPFFTTKEVGKGTGLGLSISYGIIRDFGGTIHATSPTGGGSRFIITLSRI